MKRYFCFKPGIYILILVIFAAHFPVFAYKIGSADINFKAGTSQTYDSNITYVNTGAKSDHINLAYLDTDVSFEDRLQKLSGSFNIFRQSFFRYNNLDNTGGEAGLEYGRELSSTISLSLRESFRRASQPRDFESAFGSADSRYNYNSNKVLLECVYNWRKNINFIFSCYNSSRDVSREDMVDSYANSASVLAEYTLSSRIMFMAGYEHLARDYRPGAEVKENSYKGGAKYFLGNQLYFEAMAGEDYFRSGINGKRKQSSQNFSITNDIDKTTTARLSYSRSSEAGVYSQDLFDKRQTTLAFSRPLSRRIGVSISGFYGRGEYLSSLVKDTLKGADCSVAYDLSEKTRFSLSYNYSKQGSNIVSRRYSRDVATVSVEFAF